MADLLFPGNASAPAARNPKTEIETLARASKIPVNYLFALSEASGAKTPEEQAVAAQRIAEVIGPRTAQGEKIKDILRAEMGRGADAIQQRAQQVAAELYPEQWAAKQAKMAEAQGGLVNAAKSGVDMLQQGVGSAIEGAGRSTGLQGVEDYGRRVADVNRGQAQDASQGLKTVDDITGVGSTAQFAGEQLAANAPQMGASMAGVAAGAAIGSFIPIIGTGIGGLVGGLAVNLPFFYGMNRERQKDETPDGQQPQVSESAAALAAIPQAALDTVVDKLFLGLAPTLAFLKGGGIFTRTAKATAAGALVEMPTEVGQQMLERLQAGLPVADGEAIAEYRDTAIAAGLVGGTVGGVAGGIGAARERSKGPMGTALQQGAPAQLAAPNKGGTIFGEGPVTTPPDPTQFERPPGSPPRAPAGPMGEAATLAPPPIFDGATEGLPVTLSGPDIDPIEATFVSETPVSVTVKTADGEVMEIPRTEFDAGSVTMAPTMPVEPVPLEDRPILQEGQKPVITEEPPAGGLGAKAAAQIAKPPKAKAPEPPDMSADDARARIGYLEDQGKTNGFTPAIVAERDGLQGIVDADEGVLAKKDGTPFGDEAAAKRAIKSRKGDPDAFDIVPRGAGFIARPKPPASEGETNAEPIPDQQEGGVGVPPLVEGRATAHGERPPVPDPTGEVAPPVAPAPVDPKITATPMAPAAERAQPDMLGGDPVPEEALAAKERRKREWGQLLGIAEHGKSDWDGEIEGHPVRVRRSRLRILAGDKPSDQDMTLDTQGMAKEGIAGWLRDTLQRMPPVARAAEGTTPAAPKTPVSVEPAANSTPEKAAERTTPAEQAESGVVVENIRASAAVLRGLPKDRPPVVDGASLKWDDKEGGFVFPRKHAEAVLRAARAEGDLIAAESTTTEPGAPAAEVDGAADVVEPFDTAPSLAEKIEAAATETDPEPTQAQAEAENFRTGKVQWNGLTLSIENAKGSIRKGVGADGTEWQVTMPAIYGRILGTTGADGDHVDFYMGDAPEADQVFVIDQKEADTGAFDETKSMLGFKNRKTALDFYVQGFSDGKGAERIGGHKVMSVDEFKAWLKDGDHSKPVRMDEGAPPDAPVEPPSPPPSQKEEVVGPKPEADADGGDEADAAAQDARGADVGDEMESRLPEDEGARDTAFAAELMAELAQVDDLFQNPTAKGATLAAVFSEIDPSVTYVADVASDEGSSFKDRAAAIGADKMHMLRTANEQDFYVYEGDGKVWLDVSRLSKGGAGSRIYSAVADFAFNTGQTFIGDPEGLSDVALRRRTEAMLSSSLKHGTTKHLAPHQRQIEGDRGQRVVPLKWTEGDDLGNVAGLIEASISNLIAFIPEIERARYDFSTGTFVTGQGKPIADGMFRAWSEHPRVRATGAGSATLKRGILLNTLARAESGQKPGLLELALRQPDQLVAGGLGGTFYSATPAGWGEVEADPPITDDAISGITRDLNAELAKSGLAGKASVRVVRDLTNVAGIRVGGVAAGAKIGVDPKSPYGTMGTMRHEIVHVLRNAGLWGTDYGLFTGDEWRGLVRQARTDKAVVARVARDYADKSETVRTEETVAEMYRLWAAKRDLSGPVAATMRKIMGFLEAVANALRGRGFQSAARTMERIARGDIGGRGPEGGSPRDSAGRYVGTRAEGMDLRMPETPYAATEKALDAKERGLISQALTDAMGGKSSRYNLLALVPGRALFAELGKNMPGAARYLRMKDAMDALRSKWHGKTDEVAQEWAKLIRADRKANDAMMDLMHEATREGADPSEAFKSRPKRPGVTLQEHADMVREDKAKWEALRPKFTSLPEPFQAMFRRVRDTYDDLATAFEQAILDNVSKAMTIGLDRAERDYSDAMKKIADDGLTGEAKAEAEGKAAKNLTTARKAAGWGRTARITAMRSQFESNRLDGPYFPLQRFGNYFVTVRDEAGKVVSFSRFENERKQMAFAREQRKEAGADAVTVGVVEPGVLRDQVDPNFVADIEKIIGEEIGDPAIMDMVWQRWLETLPDFSVRKSRIHRKGTPGFSGDAFRAFGRQVFHGSHQLARLTYAMEMQKALEDARREAQAMSDPNRAGLIVTEMEQRHAFTMNPTGGAVAQAITSAAFVFALAATPAAAIVNLTQTTIMGIPILSAAFDKATVARAAWHLTKAMGDFTHGRGKAERSTRLTDEERVALQTAYDSGLIDASQSHDLAGVKEAGVEYSSWRTRVMGYISWMFHHAERANREVTFLAAYRMAKENGFLHDGAITKAFDLTWKTHFDYSSTSRPRLMQSDPAKVMLVFRNFQVNMLWRLFRDLHQMTRGRSAEDRKEARAQLIGITGMMMLHAGFTGTWGYALAMTIAGLFIGGSDEAEEEVQSAMVAMFGQEVAGLLLKGVPGHLTGLDLTNRIGMPELWFRSPDRQLEGKDEGLYWLQQVAGAAVGGIALNQFVGFGMAMDGEYRRGFETAAPKALRDLSKGLRFYDEGVTTMGGETLVEDVSAPMAFMQAMGFTPAKVAEKYRENSRKRNRNEAIAARKSGLVTEAAEAIRAGEKIDPDTMAAINAFNRDAVEGGMPDDVITGKNIMRSLRARIAASKRTEDGLLLPKSRNDAIRAQAAPSIYN